MKQIICLLYCTAFIVATSAAVAQATEAREPILPFVSKTILNELTLSSDALNEKDAATTVESVERITLVALKGVIGEVCRSWKAPSSQFDPDIARDLPQACRFFPLLQQLTDQRKALNAYMSPVTLPKKWTVLHIGAGLWAENQMIAVEAQDLPLLMFKHIITQLMVEKALDGIYNHFMKTGPLTSTSDFRTTVYPWLKMKLLSVSKFDAALNLFKALRCVPEDMPCAIQKAVQAQTLTEVMKEHRQEIVGIRDFIEKIGAEGQEIPQQQRLQQTYELARIFMFIRQNLSELSMKELNTIANLKDINEIPHPAFGYLKIMSSSTHRPWWKNADVFEAMMSAVLFTRMVESVEMEHQYPAVIMVAEPYGTLEMKALQEKGWIEPVLSALKQDVAESLNSLRYFIQKETEGLEVELEGDFQ